MQLNTKYIIILDTGSVVKLATPAADVIAVLAPSRAQTRGVCVYIGVRVYSASELKYKR